MAFRRSRDLTFLVLAYLGLLWIVASAASRRNGFAWVLLGLLALGLQIRKLRRDRPEGFYRLCLLMALAAVTALGVEGLLLVRPELVTGAVANKLYSRYHVYTGGMYERDKNLGHALRADFHAMTYWNGHWWRHDTNAQGFRGPAVDRADVVFLGDSMIYGHGVETDETVPARFAAATGRPVANLGEEATALVQSSLLFRDKGVPLRPKLVFVCSHPNDLEDNTELYSVAELQRYLREPDYRPVVRETALWPKPWYDLFEVWTRHLGLPLRSSGLAGVLAKAAWDGTLKLRRGTPIPSSGSRFVPSEEYVHQPFAPLEPGPSELDTLRFHVHQASIDRIVMLARGIGARVVLLDIGYPLAFSHAIEGVARERGLEYNPAGRVVLAHVLAGEDLFLADDGHWNPKGTELVARELLRSW
jgi:hypothetical protein